MHLDSLAEKGKACAFAIVVTFVTSSAVFAQGGLIGNPPDLSNWPHPAAPVGNPFPRCAISGGGSARRCSGTSRSRSTTRCPAGPAT